jgi:putative hydrolase of the HAD superfamily
MKNVTDVFFDLDHTLWDFDRNSALAFKAIFELNAIDVPYDKFLEVYSPINFKYWKWYREDRVTKAQLRYGRFKKTFDELGITVTDDIIDKLSEDYIDYLPNNNFLFEGAFEVLDYLGSKYRLHIITNGFEEVQTKKLQNSKIDHYFDAVITSEAAGVKKPHPKIFELALRESGASVGHSIMIGDTFEADILGAEEIGMETICFNYHNLDIPAKYIVINHLTEIRDYL